MTANPNMDMSGLLDEHLAQASPDLLRSMIRTFDEALTSADADVMCGGGFNKRSEDRSCHGNGYRNRRWETRADTVKAAIPRVRTGSYFPDWPFERRRRAEAALATAVATRCLLGAELGRSDECVGNRRALDRTRETAEPRPRGHHDGRYERRTRLGA